MSDKNQLIIFYKLQPFEHTEKTDHALHIRPESSDGFKPLKRWLHDNLPRREYYYDTIAEYYTIKANGQTYLKLLEKHPSFMMVDGVPSGV